MGLLAAELAGRSASLLKMFTRCRPQADRGPAIDQGTPNLLSIARDIETRAAHAAAARGGGEPGRPDGAFSCSRSR